MVNLVLFVNAATFDSLPTDCDAIIVWIIGFHENRKQGMFHETQYTVSLITQLIIHVA